MPKKKLPKNKIIAEILASDRIGGFLTWPLAVIQIRAGDPTEGEWKRKIMFEDGCILYKSCKECPEPDCLVAQGWRVARRQLTMRIVRYLKPRGLSNREIARLTGISRQCIDQYVAKNRLSGSQ
jgi:hypothetical protein